MINTRDNQNSVFLLSAKPAPIAFLSFQVVYLFTGEQKYIRSINILHGNKILKKYYLKDLILSNENTDQESIIIETLLNKGAKVNSEKPKDSNSIRADYNARTNAAANLFTSLGI